MESRYTAASATPNPLCDRLSREFRGRGIQASHVRSAMERTVPSRLNPFEEPTAARSAESKRGTSGAAQSKARPHTESHTQCRPAQGNNSHTASAQKGKPEAKTTVKSTRDAAVRRRSAKAAAQRSREKQGLEEIRIRRPFPIAAAAMMCIFVISFMVVILSSVQNYELDSEITRMELQIQQLSKLERDLSVELEERDDIRVIEDIAVNELGMVKNDLVESRFVSVSGGERVEMAESEENTEAKSMGFFSTMLSSFGENWERLMEYIK